MGGQRFPRRLLITSPLDSSELSPDSDSLGSSCAFAAFFPAWAFALWAFDNGMVSVAAAKEGGLEGREGGDDAK